MKRANDSIITPMGGSHKINGEDRGNPTVHTDGDSSEGGQNKKFHHFSELVPGSIVRLKERNIQWLPAQEETLILVLPPEVAMGGWEPKKTLLTSRAGTSIGVQGLPLSGSMHFKPVLIDGEFATLVVWTDDDGWELVCSPQTVP